MTPCRPEDSLTEAAKTTAEATARGFLAMGTLSLLSAQVWTAWADCILDAVDSCQPAAVGAAD